MKTIIHDNSVKLWVDESETFDWANRDGASWPCSQLSGRSVFAEFDRNGLVDLTIDESSDGSIDATEFNALASDMLRGELPESHPLYFIVVGQFTSN